MLVSIATVLARGQHGAAGAGVPANGEQRAADVLVTMDAPNLWLANYPARRILHP